MGIVDRKLFRNEKVRLDGQHFVNCKFEDCLLVYGGGHCEWENCQFKDCRLSMEGSANNTMQVLQGLGVLQMAKSDVVRIS